MPSRGNIRELRNLIERAVILSDGRTLEIEHFPGFEPVLNFHTPVTDPKRFNLEAMEKATIENALKESGFNKSKAANMLGITWQTLDRKIKKHQIDSAEKAGSLTDSNVQSIVNAVTAILWFDK